MAQIVTTACDVFGTKANVNKYTVVVLKVNPTAPEMAIPPGSGEVMANVTKDLGKRGIRRLLRLVERATKPPVIKKKKT